MTSIDDVMIEITPQVLLKAYACGIFPMAESAEDNALYWIEPERRGILPLDRVHVPRRLARTIRQGGFEVRVDNDFHDVIDGCAAPRTGRRSTWINGRIRGLYADLFALGHCHTVEVWDDDELMDELEEREVEFHPDTRRERLIYLLRDDDALYSRAQNGR